SNDTTVRLWDAATAAEIAVLNGHKKAVLGVAFAPDGKVIMTTSEDGTVLLWDVFSTQMLIEASKVAVPRCLTREQREQFGLSPQPPKWCLEMGKWPYQHVLVEQWIDQRLATRTPVGAFHLARFKDPMYVLTKSIGWAPNAQQVAR